MSQTDHGNVGGMTTSVRRNRCEQPCSSLANGSVFANLKVHRPVLAIGLSGAFYQVGFLTIDDQQIIVNTTAPRFELFGASRGFLLEKHRNAGLIWLKQAFEQVNQ